MKFRSAAPLACGTMLAAALCMGAQTPSPPPAPGMTTEQWLAKFQTAWDATNTYTATITAHEVLNGKTQDRVYAIWFQKPTNVRVDVTDGDGKGSVAVWQGGDRVRGHQGGWLSMIKLNLDIHARLATTMRGTTIVQSYFGYFLDHVKTLKYKSTDVTVNGDTATLTAVPEDPAQDEGYVKEVLTLGGNGLPVELDMYDASNNVVKTNAYTNVKLNVDVPASTWQI